MKKKSNNKTSLLQIGKISDVSGEINIAGNNITAIKFTNGFSASEIKQLFDQLYVAIETNAKASSENKEDLKAEVKEIQATVTEAAQKNEKVDEGSLACRFRNIARMAPDVLDVVVATLANPLAGLGVTVKKIAEKAKEDAE